MTAWLAIATIATLTSGFLLGIGLRDFENQLANWQVYALSISLLVQAGYWGSQAVRRGPAGPFGPLLIGAVIAIMATPPGMLFMWLLLPILGTVVGATAISDYRRGDRLTGAILGAASTGYFVGVLGSLGDAPPLTPEGSGWLMVWLALAVWTRHRKTEPARSSV